MVAVSLYATISIRRMNNPFI